MPDFTNEDIKLIRDVCIEPMEHDIRIAEDAQAHSNWFVGVAIAGFSLTIVRGDELAPCSSSLVDDALLVMGSLFSIASAITGTLVRRFRNRSLMYGRKVMSLILGQCALIQVRGVEVPQELTLKELTRGIMGGEFTGNLESACGYKKDNEKYSEMEDLSRNLATAQQLFVAIAYACIFVLFLMSRLSVA